MFLNEQFVQLYNWKENEKLNHRRTHLFMIDRSNSNDLIPIVYIHMEALQIHSMNLKSNFKICWLIFFKSSLLVHGHGDASWNVGGTRSLSRIHKENMR